MTFEEIENLTYAELKEQRESILEAIGAQDATVPIVAARYLQARMDAKQRDEKLSEQGSLITALQQGNAALADRCADLDMRLAESRGIGDALSVESERWKNTAMLEADRSDRLRNMATVHQNAMTAIAKLANDAISMQLIDLADKGE